MTPLNRRPLHVGLLGVIACAAALCYYITRPYVGIPVGKPTWEWVFARIEWEWPDVPQMTTSQLADRLATDDPPELIDTRTWKEYAVSHLPGAIWAKTPAQIRAAISDVPTTRSVVLYCSVGIRSSKAAALMMQDGRRNIFNLRGSIFEWANEGRALEHDGNPAAAVHPYNRKWGVLLDPKLHARSPR